MSCERSAKSPLKHFAAVCATISAFIGQELLAEPAAAGLIANPESVKPNISRSTSPVALANWADCIRAAQQARSSRDLDFFVRSSNLSNAKTWFIAHSTANEKRFCSDILACESFFNKIYEATASDYPSC